MDTVFMVLLAILMSVSADPVVDCSPSVKEVTCSCSNTSLYCSGKQEEFLDIVEVIVNVSGTFFYEKLFSVHIAIENLTLVPNSSFRNAMIKSLKLSYGLSHLEDTIFSEIDDTLEVLNLSFNNFDGVPSDGLMNLSHLHILDLSYNNIKMLSKNDFRGLENLTSLDLSHNAISVIEHGAFSNLVSLKVLYLHYNELQFLNSTVFKGLHGLISLSISGNRLDSLSSESFNFLSSLKTLFADEISLMNVENIRIKSFVLQELSVKHCAVQGPLKTDSVKSLSRLIFADFSYNNISEIHSFTLSALSQLKHLKLSYNNIKTLQKDAFSSLYNLNKLDLQYNDIQVVGESAFYNLTKLKYLNLNNNKIKAFLCSYTVDLLSLESIYLENNQIKIIQSGTFIFSQNLVELKLTGNELNCTCLMYDFSTYLVNRTSSWKEDINEIKCNSPANVQGKSVTEVDFSFMVCISSPPCESRLLELDDDSDDYDAMTVTPSVSHENSSSVFNHSSSAMGLSFNMLIYTFNNTFENTTTTDFLTNVTDVSEDQVLISASKNLTSYFVDVTHDAGNESLVGMSIPLPYTLIFSGIPNNTVFPTDAHIWTDMIDRNQTLEFSEFTSSVAELPSTVSVIISDTNVTTVAGVDFVSVAATEINSSSATKAVPSLLSTFTPVLGNLTSFPTEIDIHMNTSVTSSFTVIPLSLSLIDIKNYTLINKKLCIDWAVNDLAILREVKGCMLGYIYEQSKPVIWKYIKCPSIDGTAYQCLNYNKAKIIIELCIKVINSNSKTLANFCVHEHYVDSPVISSGIPVSQNQTSVPLLIANTTAEKETGFADEATTELSFSGSSAATIILSSTSISTHENLTSPSTDSVRTKTSVSVTSEFADYPISFPVIDIKNYSLINKLLCIDWSISDTVYGAVKMCFLSYTHEQNKSEIRRYIKCPSSDGTAYQCLHENKVRIINDLCIKVINSSNETFASSCVHGHYVDSYVPSSSVPVSSDQTTVLSIKKTLLHEAAFNITNINISEEEASVAIKWSVNREEPSDRCILRLSIKSNSTVKTAKDFDCTNNSYIVNQEQNQTIDEICLTSSHSSYGIKIVCKDYPFKGTRVLVAAVTSSSQDHSYVILIILFVLAICFMAVVAARSIIHKRSAADAYNVTKEEKKISLRKESVHSMNQDYTYRFSYGTKEMI